MADNLEFRPKQGLMGIAERLAKHAGLEKFWSGDEGLEGVARQVLTDAGVPDAVALSPRSVAESSGLIKRKRRAKRVRA